MLKRCNNNHTISKYQNIQLIFWISNQHWLSYSVRGLLNHGNKQQAEVNNEHACSEIVLRDDDDRVMKWYGHLLKSSVRFCAARSISVRSLRVLLSYREFNGVNDDIDATGCWYQLSIRGSECTWRPRVEHTPASVAAAAAAARITTTAGNRLCQSTGTTLSVIGRRCS